MVYRRIWYVTIKGPQLNAHRFKFFDLSTNNGLIILNFFFYCYLFIDEIIRLCLYIWINRV